MNTLFTVFLLAATHASIVALMALLARLCVPRSAAAGRVRVGAIGMLCILAVTVAAAMPLPGFLAISRRSGSHGKNSRTADPSSNARVPVSAVTAGQPAGGDALSDAGAAPFSLTLLTRFGSGVQQATAAAASSRGWKWLLITMCAVGTGIGLARLAIALCAVKQLRRTSEPVSGEAIGHMLHKLCESAGYRRTIEIREASPLRRRRRRWLAEAPDSVAERLAGMVEG